MTTWYGAFAWSADVVQREVVRDTGKFIITERGHRIAKDTANGGWYPTRGEAVARLFLIRRKALESARRRVMDIEAKLAPLIERYGDIHHV